jgi:hypothetical protein
MKAGSRFLGSIFLGLCASIGCAGLVHAQTWPNLPTNYVPVEVSLASVSVVTTGMGIPVTTNTYAEYKWYLGCWQDVASMGPMIRKGNDFSYNFDIEEEPPGEPIPMCVVIENTTVVLGKLAPGTYTLTTTSWNVPITTNTFTIPTNPPVLHPIGFGGDGSFQIQLLNGVTNVSYVLQYSTNYVNWISLSTNSVGQPLSDPSPVLPGSRFYRVQILQQ